MKRKYTAAALLSISLTAGAVSYQLANAAEPLAGRYQDESGQLRMLDAQLAAKVSEFMQLSTLLTEQLAQARSMERRPVQDPLLVGDAPLPVQPVATPIPVPASEPAATPPSEPQPKPRHAAPPWWDAYHLSMVVVSDGMRSAVVNGRYVRAGETVDPGIEVEAVHPGSVVLVRSGKRATLTMK